MKILRPDDSTNVAYATDAEKFWVMGAQTVCAEYNAGVTEGGNSCIDGFRNELFKFEGLVRRGFRFGE